MTMNAKKLFFILVLAVIIVIPMTVNLAAGDLNSNQDAPMAQQPKVIIYGIEGCGHTAAARRDYPEHIFYNVYDDEARMDELLQLTGGARRWPVLIINGRVKIGYGGT